ncbi:MAG: hypothetical protein H6831_06505 [Planctomycetes bacterium]|nr:hypothetical protein [Planctomycetota bacterium]MCB9904040.1 hypothetical protein [Planctomycetota bacterium]
MSVPPKQNETKSGDKQKTAKSTTGDTSAKKATPTKPDEMSEEVLEFITAIDEYKRVHQRQFPNWSEVLEILKTLGYSRVG